MSVHSRNCESFTDDSVVGFKSLCMFCLKCAASTKKENSNIFPHTKASSSVNKFVKFLHRFVEQDERRNSDGVKEFGCCSDCEFIINSFCQEYHQLKCVELQLEWRLSKLVNIMKLANRVPSRVQHLRSMFAEFQQDGCNDMEHNGIKNDNEEKLKQFETFRRRLMRNCSLPISKSQPRVLLKRFLTEGTTTSALSFSPAPLKCEDEIMTGALGNFLGWLMSFVAVASLASAISSSTEKSNTAIVAEGIGDLSFELDDSLLMQIDEECEDVDVGERVSQEDDIPLVKVAQLAYDEVTGMQNDRDAYCTEEDNFDNTSADGDDKFLVAQDDSDSLVVHQTAGETCNDIASSPTTDIEPPSNRFERYIASTISQYFSVLQNTHSPKSTLKKLKMDDDGQRSRDANNMCLEKGEFSREHFEKDMAMGNGSDSDNDYSSESSHQDEMSEVEKEESTKKDFSQRYERSHLIKQEDTSSPVPVVAKSYNLREREKKSYTQVAAVSSEDEEEENTSDMESDAVSRGEETSSLSSSSDTSEASDQESTTNQVQELSDNLKKLQKQRICGRAIFCTFDGCDIKFYNIRGARAKEHMQLHALGHYQCNFCDMVLDSVINLITHEKDLHSPDNKRKPFVGQSLFSCSRCTYKTRRIYRYHWHFAKTHVSGFTGTKFTGKEDTECTICQVAVLKTRLDAHFSINHDTTNVDSSKILHCPSANCSAYFKRKIQLFRHNLLVHRPAVLYDPEQEKDCIELLKRTDSDVEKTVYKCKLCQREYSFFGNYKHHKRVYHNSEIVCRIPHCKERFNTLEALETHQKLHGSFSCFFCKVVKENATELALHERKHAHGTHPKDQKNRDGVIHNYHCSRCHASFARKKDYINHFIQSHLELSTATNTCPICKAESWGKTVGRGRNKGGRDHYRRFHETNGLDPSEIFRCQKCPAYFIKSVQLTIHLVTIHYKYTCPECGYDTKERGKERIHNLKRHIEKTHPHIDAFPYLSFRCDWKTCKFGFSTQSELDTHKMMHNRREEYERLNCPKCDKKLNGPKKLKVHLNRIHGPRTHMCSDCGKAYKTKEVLQQHMNSHKGPDGRKFPCVTCGKKFLIKANLERHTRTHTKEKPFVCDVCGLQYSQQQELKNHLKKNHKE